MEKAAQYRRTIGETIRGYRKRLKLSQEKLAEKADLHANFVSELERGHKNVSLDTLVRLAKALKVKVEDLVQGF